MAYSTPTARSTASGTATFKRVISDMISIIDPMETPLVQALGYGKSNYSKFRIINQPGITTEWLNN